MIAQILKFIQISLLALAGDSTLPVRSATMRWLRRLLDGVPSAWTQPPEHGRFLTGSAEQSGLAPLTNSVLLLGDAQIHHFGGDPDSTSNFLDPWSEPSARPALQGLFGERLMRRLIREPLQTGRYSMVVFLGDALNTSCEAELRRFDAVVRSLFGPAGEFPNVPFILLPGNHDGLLYGNLGPRTAWRWLDGSGAWRKLGRWVVNQQSREWTCRCAEDVPGGQGGTVDRNHFHDYQAALLADFLEDPGPTDRLVSARNDHERPGSWIPDSDVGLEGLSRRNAQWRTLPFHGIALQYLEGRQPGATPSLLQWAVRYEDRRNPQRSFLLQLVELPGCVEADASVAAIEERSPRPTTLALMFDTSNFARRPRAAGLVGGIGRLQQLVANVLIDKALARLQGERAGMGAPNLIFVGHHPIQALPWRARWLLTHSYVDQAQKNKVKPIPLYLSGHRHRGGWYRHRINEHALSIGQSVRWTDLNVSSLVDWPIAVRDLRLWETPGSEGPIVVESRQQVVVDIEAARSSTCAQTLAAKAIGLQDARSQRSNTFRQTVSWRLRSITLDPDRDAYCADYAVLVASAATLTALHRQLTKLLDPPVANDEACRYTALERLERAVQAIEGAPRVKVFRMYRNWAQQVTQLKALHRQLRFAVYDCRAALISLMDACAEADALVCEALIWSAVEDRYLQWGTHDELPVGIGERWYREASNLSETYASLAPSRLADQRLPSGRWLPILQFAGRPGAIGTRIAEWYAFARARQVRRARG